MSKFFTNLWRTISFIYSIALLTWLVIVFIGFVQNEFDRNTSVGDVYIGGVAKDKTSNYILTRVVSYMDDLDINVTYNNVTVPIDKSFIEYDHNQTLTNIVDGANSELFAEYNVGVLSNELDTILPDNMTEIVDMTKLIDDIQDSYQKMEPMINIYIRDYIEDISSIFQPLNEYVYITEKNDEILAEIIDLEIIVPENDRFSMIEQFGIRAIPQEYMNILATGINAITLDSNFISYEKYNSRITYVNLNHNIEEYETSVNKYQDRDFSFYNPYDLYYEIEIRNHSNGLYFILWGIPFDEEYGHYTVDNPIDYISLPDDYEPEEGSIHIFGADGKEISVYRYTVINGQNANETLLYTNYFSPRNEAYEK